MAGSNNNYISILVLYLSKEYSYSNHIYNNVDIYIINSNYDSYLVFNRIFLYFCILYMASYRHHILVKNLMDLNML